MMRSELHNFDARRSLFRNRLVKGNAHMFDLKVVFLALFSRSRGHLTRFVEIELMNVALLRFFTATGDKPAENLSPFASN